MSELRKKLDGISQDVMQIYVTHLLDKHQVSEGKRVAVSEEQKQRLLETAASLKEQVDLFLNNQEIEETKAKVKSKKRKTMRDKLIEKKDKAK